MNDWSDEETNDPLVADVRNFYKVEKWTRDGEKVDSLLYAGNNLDKTRDIFAQGDKAPAADQVDHSAANAGIGAMAAEVKATARAVGAELRTPQAHCD
jgi:hypothetical protein